MSGLRTFAYLRVSTALQECQNQLLEIQAAGFQIADHRVVAETVSGSVAAMTDQSRTNFVKYLTASSL